MSRSVGGDIAWAIEEWDAPCRHAAAPNDQSQETVHAGHELPRAVPRPCRHKPEPVIEHPNDAIVRVTRSCICGSDLHLYHGLVPDTRVGHDVRPRVHRRRRGGRPVGPQPEGRRLACSCRSTSFCGTCFFCQRELYGNCHNTTPRRRPSAASTATRTRPAATTAGRPSTCACPIADVGPTVIPDDIDLDDAVLLTDVFPTGYQAAEMGESSRATRWSCSAPGRSACSPRSRPGCSAPGASSSSTTSTTGSTSRSRFAQCETVDFRRSATWRCTSRR